VSQISQTTASEFAQPIMGDQSHFLIRRLHSLTGILFGGYVVVHLIVNATLIQGTLPKDIYQIQVDKIHSLPFLWAIEWAFIYLPIIFHAVYGTWIVFTGQPNVGAYGYAKNWAYLLQRISAVLIGLFILFHVLGFKGLLGNALTFDEHQATLSAARSITCCALVAYVIYPVGILASCFHLANGFWAAAITWGLTVSAAAQRRWGYLCAGLFILISVCGFLALTACIHNKTMIVVH